jgi:hypothetical protein
MVTGNITIDPGGDFFSPNILNPLVDGLAVTTVAPGTSVLFTATIDDTARGNNNIGGANYSVDFAPSSPMTAQDLSFDSPMEVAEATIDTTGWTNGAHTVCVAEAWDIIPNYNTLEIECATINIDGQPPGVGSVALDGNTVSWTVMDGTATVLTATVDDVLTGNSDIASAWYTIDGGPNIPMTAVNAPFDNPTEDVTDTIDTTGMGQAAPYNICVYGDDVLGNTFTGTACISLTVTVVDGDPPDISSLVVPAQVVQDQTFDITAVLDDTVPPTGPNAIQNASYDVRVQATGASQASGPMDATDGTFNSDYEAVRALAVDSTGWPLGSYEVYVYGCDVIPNCGWISTPASLEIVTTVEDPPEITVPLATPDTFNVNGTVTTILLTATLDDTNTGGLNIANASYSLAGGAGVAMTAVDLTFDSVSEDVEATVDVSGLTVGTYDICIFGADTSGVVNVSGTACATITAEPEDADITDPSMGSPSVTPEAPKEGDRVTVSIDVTDDSGLTVTITISGPGAVPIVTDQDMGTPTGDTFSYQTVALTTTGGYSYTITATDDAGNSDTTSGTFTVEEKPDEPGFDLWIWILLIIIIIVIVALIAFFATRKKPEEEIPEVPLEEELPPEEEFPPEEEAFVEEEVVEEAPPEEVVEEAPPEEVVEEPAPVEEAPMEEAPAEEAPAEEAPVEEEAAPAGPATCPNCGTVNPEGISVCTSCGSPL